MKTIHIYGALLLTAGLLTTNNIFACEGPNCHDTPDNGGNGQKKYTICHVPPGNPENAHTITISEAALQAHFEHHGDYYGECKSEDDSDEVITPIPVELINFEANKVGDNKVELKWTTATESNSDYIAIEKSSDINTWEEVCRVASQNTEQLEKTYSCMDNNASINGNNITYYRPKQVDFNGTYEYFNIIKLRLEDATYASTVESVYPNPASDRLHVKYNASENGLFNIKLMSLDGKELVKNEFVAKPGEQTFDIDIPEVNLKSGFYILEVQNDDQVFRQKVYKQ